MNYTAAESIFDTLRKNFDGLGAQAVLCMMVDIVAAMQERPVSTVLAEVADLTSAVSNELGVWQEVRA